MARAFDDLGTPLSQVTFCVVDLETTGGSPERCGITEVGAVKVRGGECLGTFQTLVHPGCAIPPEITVLTGITESMVARAPRVEGVLASLAEFAAGTVIVGHNVRFDLSFLREAYRRAVWPPMAHPSVDTLPLARRLLRDEVPNCRLGTLAEVLGLDHRPSHRALDDALATTDLLHLLLERAAAFGVLGLDDLLALPRLAGHPQVAKLALTRNLPRAPGVFLFRDRQGRVLYTGKATDLRARVRATFADAGARASALLRETASIDHQVCRSPLEAAVLEVRLLHELLPRHNPQSATWPRTAYLKLSLHEPYPRLAVVRTPRPDGALYLGPLRSAGVARRVADAIEAAVALRRCTQRVVPGQPSAGVACTAAPPGAPPCPCAGGISPEEYAPRVQRVVRGLTHDPEVLLAPLRDHMAALAAEQRFEEATTVRAGAEALAGALRRQRRSDALRRAGRVELRLPGGARAWLHDGLLVGVAAEGELEPVHAAGPVLPPDPSRPLPRPIADEVDCIATWLDRHARRVRLVHATGEWSSPSCGEPTFLPTRGTAGGVDPARAAGSGQQEGAGPVDRQDLRVALGR